MSIITNPPSVSTSKSTLNTDICPKCRSDDIFFSKKRQTFTCEDCNNKWKVITGSELTKQEVEKQFCHKLANSEDWQALVFENYPAPIAHEYKQLQNTLSKGLFIASTLQLKDLVEITVKMTVISMYQSVKNYQANNQNNNETNNKPSNFLKAINTQLLSKPLSLGSWVGIARQLSHHILESNYQLQQTDEHLQIQSNLEMQLASWLYIRKSNGKFKPTKLSIWLDDMVEWRNKEIGHGALRIDNSEQFDDFKERIEKAHQYLGKTNPWQDYELVIDSSIASNIDSADDVYEQNNKKEQNNLQQMTGWQSIRERHDLLSLLNQAMHHLHTHRLYLQGIQTGERIEISPFIEVKACTYCNLQDVFVFDGVDKNRFYCIDYLSGHRLKLETNNSKDLQLMLDQHNFLSIEDMAQISGIEEYQSLDQQAISKSLIKLLEDKSLESSYTTPKYLHEEFTKYLESKNSDDNIGNDSGIFWLQAPAHVGKSTFIHGISKLEKKPIVPNAIVLSFHISREYRYFAHHMVESIQNQLINTFDVVSGNDKLPEINYDDGKNALINWLNEWWKISRKQYSHRLIIAIDGLDEIGKPQSEDSSQLSIVDLLPDDTSEELNDNLHILLTSRPVVDCPNWMQEQLETQLTTISYLVSIDLHNTGYNKLLKSHYDSQLQDLIKPFDTETQQHIFNTLVVKSDTLFLYFSMLIEQIRAQQLSLTDIDSLPLGKQLYGYFLDRLEQLLGGCDSKGFVQIRDILTLLTACEQAFHNDANQQSKAMQMGDTDFSLAYSPEWQGINIDTLTGLLNEPHGRHSSRFIFALYSIKSLMKVERSGTSALYRIGLKALNTYVAERWQAEVQAWHVRLSVQFYDWWQGGQHNRLNAEIHENTYLCRYALSHAYLASELHYHQLLADAKLCTYYYQRYEADELELFARHALAWLNLSIIVHRKNIQTIQEVNSPLHENLYQLAHCYIKRMELLEYMKYDELSECKKSHDKAIETVSEQADDSFRNLLYSDNLKDKTLADNDEDYLKDFKLIMYLTHYIRNALMRDNKIELNNLRSYDHDIKQYMSSYGHEFGDDLGHISIFDRLNSYSSIEDYCYDLFDKRESCHADCIRNAVELCNTVHLCLENTLKYQDNIFDLVNKSDYEFHYSLEGCKIRYPKLIDSIICEHEKLIQQCSIGSKKITYQHRLLKFHINMAIRETRHHYSNISEDKMINMLNNSLMQLKYMEDECQQKDKPLPLKLQQAKTQIFNSLIDTDLYVNIHFNFTENHINEIDKIKEMLEKYIDYMESNSEYVPADWKTIINKNENLITIGVSLSNSNNDYSQRVRGFLHSDISDNMNQRFVKANEILIDDVNSKILELEAIHSPNKEQTDEIIQQYQELISKLTTKVAYCSDNLDIEEQANRIFATTKKICTLALTKDENFIEYHRSIQGGLLFCIKNGYDTQAEELIGFVTDSLKNKLDNLPKLDLDDLNTYGERLWLRFCSSNKTYGVIEELHESHIGYIYRYEESDNVEKLAYHTQQARIYFNQLFHALISINFANKAPKDRQSLAEGWAESIGKLIYGSGSRIYSADDYLSMIEQVEDKMSEVELTIKAKIDLLKRVTRAYFGCACRYEEEGMIDAYYQLKEKGIALQENISSIHLQVDNSLEYIKSEDYKLSSLRDFYRACINNQNYDYAEKLIIKKISETKKLYLKLVSLRDDEGFTGEQYASIRKGLNTDLSRSLQSLYDIPNKNSKYEEANRAFAISKSVLQKFSSSFRPVIYEGRNTIPVITKYQIMGYAHWQPLIIQASLEHDKEMVDKNETSANYSEFLETYHKSQCTLNPEQADELVYALEVYLEYASIRYYAEDGKSAIDFANKALAVYHKINETNMDSQKLYLDELNMDTKKLYQATKEDYNIDYLDNSITSTFEVYQVRANAHEKLGDYPSSIADLSKIIHYVEDIIATYVYAVSATEKSISSLPNSVGYSLASVYINRAMLHNLVGQYDEANHDFEQATQIHYKISGGQIDKQVDEHDIIDLEHEIYWFLQGILLIDAESREYLDMNVITNMMKNDTLPETLASDITAFVTLQHPDRVILKEHIEYRFALSKYHLKPLLETEPLNTQKYTQVYAELLHDMANAFVLSAMFFDEKLIDFLKLEFNSLKPAVSEVVTIGESFEENLTVYAYHTATQLHHCAIVLMQKAGYAYPSLWDNDYNVASLLHDNEFNIISNMVENDHLQ